MKRIDIRGVIVSAELDQDYFADYIAKGVITPESRIRAQLDEASAAGEDVELYVNSRGGSCFAGNEMINAVKQFATSGRTLQITVGSIAASMAANLIATVPATVRAFSNSKIMFHSAYAIMLGGPDGLRDEASLLDSINADVIAALTAKSPDKKDEIETWFQEGRAGWLSAKQALDMGIVSEILDAADQPSAELSKEEADKMLQSGVDLAAFDFHEDASTAAAIPPSVSPVVQPSGQTAMVTMASFEALTSEHESLKARFSGLQSAKDKEIAQLKSAMQEAKTDFDGQLAKLRTDLDAAIAESSARADKLATAEAALVATGKQLEAKTTALAKLTGETLSEPTTFAGWDAAVKKLGYVEARKQHPELFEALMASTKGHTK